MKREKILKIEEYEIPADDNHWNSKAGYKITTNLQEITMLIDNESSCCESWGYMMTNDDIKEFIGAYIFSISLTDTELGTKNITPKCENDDDDDGDDRAKHVMFVNIDTTRGTLQFAAYNEHNGYYGHEVEIKSHQLTHTDTL